MISNISTAISEKGLKNNKDKDKLLPVTSNFLIKLKILICPGVY